MPSFTMPPEGGEKAFLESQTKAWRAAKRMSMEIGVRELEIVLCCIEYDKESLATLKKGIKERIKYLQSPSRLVE